MIEHRINDETGHYEVKHGDQWLDLFGGDEPTLGAAIEIILSQRDACRLAAHAATAAELDAKEAKATLAAMGRAVRNTVTNKQLQELYLATDPVLREFAATVVFQFAQACKERDAAVSRLAQYRKAVAERLHLDMQSVITGTDEWQRRRQAQQEHEEVERLIEECRVLKARADDSAGGEMKARTVLAGALRASASWRRKYKALVDLVAVRRLHLKESISSALIRTLRDAVEARKAFPHHGCIPLHVSTTEMVKQALKERAEDRATIVRLRAAVQTMQGAIEMAKNAATGLENG